MDSSTELNIAIAKRLGQKVAFVADDNGNEVWWVYISEGGVPRAEYTDDTFNLAAGYAWLAYQNWKEYESKVA